MVTLQTWAEQMSEDLRLCDFRPRTREGYLVATRQFMDWVGRAPSRLAVSCARTRSRSSRSSSRLPSSRSPPCAPIPTTSVARSAPWPSSTPGHAPSNGTLTSTCSCPAAPSRPTAARGGPSCGTSARSSCRRFLDLARRALPDVRFPEIPWGKRWVVFAKPAVRGPEEVLDDLGRYVHRTAMSDKAIVRCDDDNVVFTYRRSSDGQRRTMPLPVHELLRRFLQHVLPRGFHRIRAFGLLHPAHRGTLRRLQLALAPRPSADKPAPRTPAKVGLRCPHCGQPALVLVRRLSPAAAIERAAATLAVAPVARAPPAPPRPPVTALCP